MSDIKENNKPNDIVIQYLKTIQYNLDLLEIDIQYLKDSLENLQVFMVGMSCLFLTYLYCTYSAV